MEEGSYIGLSSLRTASDKSFYHSVLEAILAGVERIPLDGVESQRAFELLHVVLCDHPELYWTNFRAQAGGTPPSLCFIFPNEVARTPETDFELNNALNRIVGEMPASDSEYELAKAAYIAIASRSEYGESGVDGNDPAFLRAHSCIGCILDHRAVCEGVAKAMQLLLHRLGIASYLVCGKAGKAGEVAEDHAWLLVRIEGLFYYMDPTWGGCGEGGEPVSFAHFLMCDDDVKGVYELDDSGILPICDNGSGTYFAREGLLLNEWGYQEFRRALSGRFDADSRHVELKFGTQRAYEAAKASIPNDDDYVEVLRREADPFGSRPGFQFLYSFMDDYRVLSLIALDGAG